MASTDRYARQRALPKWGDEAQERLGRARVLVIGCGALGTVQAELLARAGLGALTIADRDYVELSNLQRQLLFDDEDASLGRPKAEAAARRLRAINPTVRVTPLVRDLDGQSLPTLVREHDLVLDATDNAETRYALNDACVQEGRPWIYGGAVATGGLFMAIRPGVGPCLRCLFPEPPAPGSLPTCDLAGVLGPTTAAVASFQTAEALKILSGKAEPSNELWSLELWPLRIQSVAAPRDPGCPCCGERRFEFLGSDAGVRARALCGRDAVQLSPPPGWSLSLDALEARLVPMGRVARAAESMLRFVADDAELVVFGDGRVIVKGTDDIGRARSIAARYVGS